MQVFEKQRASRAEPGRRRSRATPERQLLHAVERQRHRSNVVRQGLRRLGALSLLAVGAVHLQQYVTLYSSIPTIGRLFVLNFIGATAIGVGLLAPVERVLGRRGDAAVALLALGGIALAATAFVFLLVSERTPLFGFMEPGYDPPAIMAVRVAELATVGLLGGFLAPRLWSRSPAGRR
jgi:hypothetical protein